MGDKPPEYFVQCVSLGIICGYVLVNFYLIWVLLKYCLYTLKRQVMLIHIYYTLRFDKFMEDACDVLKLNQMSTILLLLSGDVHPNPGPNPNSTNARSDLAMCHLNIRSLSQDKLRCIKTS